MSSKKATIHCPLCSGAVTEARGFFSCAVHGIVPYDWAMGTITRDKALDMMAKWGHEIPRARAQKTPQRPVRAPDDPTPKRAPAEGVAGLLAALRVETSPVEKRKLRARLRAAGHTGGLRG